MQGELLPPLDFCGSHSLPDCREWVWLSFFNLCSCCLAWGVCCVFGWQPPTPRPPSPSPRGAPCRRRRPGAPSRQQDSAHPASALRTALSGQGYRGCTGVHTGQSHVTHKSCRTPHTGDGKQIAAGTATLAGQARPTERGTSTTHKEHLLLTIDQCERQRRR
jgi:hypothetical protein